MKKLLVSTALATGLLGFAAAASAQECGDVTIARMNWASAEVIANIDKIILGAGYGCDADIVIGDRFGTSCAAATSDRVAGAMPAATSAKVDKSGAA